MAYIVMVKRSQGSAWKKDTVGPFETMKSAMDRRRSFGGYAHETKVVKTKAPAIENPQRGKLPINKKIRVNYIIVKKDGTVQASVPVKRNPGSIDASRRFPGGRGGGNSPAARKRARISELKSLGQYRTVEEDREYKRLASVPVNHIVQNPSGKKLYAIFETRRGYESRQVDERSAATGAAAIRLTRASQRISGNMPPSGTKFKAVLVK